MAGFRPRENRHPPWPEPLVWESFTREQAFTASCDASGHVELIITLRETDRLGEKTRWEASITQYWELGDLAESVQPLVWYLEARVSPVANGEGFR